MRPVLLDTHAIIWSAEGSLGASGTRAVRHAARHSAVMLCPISAWEIGMLVQKGRLKLSVAAEDFVRVIFSAPGVVTAVLTAEIALKAATLTLHNDPADRLIIASAIAYGADLLTRDAAILRLAGKVPGLHVVRV